MKLIRNLMMGVSLLVATGCANEKDTAPVEVGSVNWKTDYDTALAEAKKTDKPMLLFFQEVPG